MSYLFRFFFINAESAGKGPSTDIFFFLQYLIAGKIFTFSSSPISPPSPACGLSAVTAIRGFLILKSFLKLRLALMMALMIFFFIYFARNFVYCNMSCQGNSF